MNPMSKTSKIFLAAGLISLVLAGCERRSPTDQPGAGTTGSSGMSGGTSTGSSGDSSGTSGGSSGMSSGSNGSYGSDRSTSGTSTTR
jgi:hypothetical protein